MDHVNPPTVIEAVGGYSHGTAAEGSRLLFISGQTPEGVSGDVDSDPYAQFAQIWSNIRQVLRAAGADVDALVSVRTYLADRRFARANTEVRQRVLAGHAPALTVVVCELFEEGWVAEIEAVAEL